MYNKYLFSGCTYCQARCWWLTPVILVATYNSERIVVSGQNWAKKKKRFQDSSQRKKAGCGGTCPSSQKWMVGSAK
jgi:hypothetical protein